MVEAQLGELSTLQPIAGGVFNFVNSDPQYLNTASFLAPISNQDGTRINASNTIGNMFLNCFTIVKRIELIGGFTETAGDTSTLFVGNPIVTGQIYQGGLCVTHNDSIVFTPDSFAQSRPDLTKKNVPFSRYYWDGEMLFNAFTSLNISIRSGIDLEHYTGLIFYFDEVYPMSRYPEFLKSMKSWNSDNGCTTPEMINS